LSTVGAADAIDGVKKEIALKMTKSEAGRTRNAERAKRWTAPPRQKDGAASELQFLPI
jgi:hypothetical protein